MIPNMSDLKDALLRVTQHVYHGFAMLEEDQYILWSEDGSGMVQRGDGMTLEQAIEGTIDYFTKQEYDPNVQRIQDEINGINLAWRFDGMDYEQETGYWHYSWIWQVATGWQRNPQG